VVGRGGGGGVGNCEYVRKAVADSRYSSLGLEWDQQHITVKNDLVMNCHKMLWFTFRSRHAEDYIEKKYLAETVCDVWTGFIWLRIRSSGSALRPS
jgi:hypothetical protein